MISLLRRSCKTSISSPTHKRDGAVYDAYLEDVLQIQERLWQAANPSLGQAGFDPIIIVRSAGRPRFFMRRTHHGHSAIISMHMNRG